MLTSRKLFKKNSTKFKKIALKGISPLIAAVLLIAFTVAVGGLISVWLPGLLSTQTQTVSTIAEKATKCAATSLNIKEVRYKSGSNFVNVTVEVATGSEKLRNLTITVSGGGKLNTSATAFTTDDFDPGEIFATSIDVTNGATVPPELVTARAFCQTTYPILRDCKSGDTCMKPS